MKKGTSDHPKTVDLSDRLKINRAWACGILELLWGFTRDYAPEGDVGRFSDSAIARAVHWPKSPEVLISALKEHHWLDTCDVHRLVIHDWPDHVDDYTRKKLKRSSSDFVPCLTKSGQCTDKVRTNSDIESGQFSTHARAVPCLASASASALPESQESERVEPNPATNGTRLNWQGDEGYQSLKSAYEEAGACPGGVTLTEADWATGFFPWRQMDFDQKLAAVQGIRDRQSAGTEGKYYQKPERYLQGGYKSEVRARAPAKQQQASLDDKVRIRGGRLGA